MTESFYWYDLETSGTDPRWDRVVQFAGFRTDANLEHIGDEQSFYVRLPDDVLPNPDASLVTGITPQRTHAEGVTEWQAMNRLQSLFSQPGTCAVGYNSLRFDDEFVRYGFYRNLRDPYAREWQNGNSRWDLIDLVRAAGALRREGINWPQGDDGLPVYKLELLTQANGLDHGQAHDALSDVQATVALARLIQRSQPRLFHYYFGLRFKKAVRQLLEPVGAAVCVHVSGMYPRAQYGTAPVVSVCRHPKNSNSVVVADLSQDVEPLLSWSAERIRESLFSRGASPRPPLKEIRINRCPFVAELGVLTEENWSRLGFDAKLIKERHRRLGAPGIAQKIMKVYAGQTHEPPGDVDAALYDGFLQDEDRRRCESFVDALNEGRWTDLDYADPRLGVLASRLKARSFEQFLTADEADEWSEFVASKLTCEQRAWLNLNAFSARVTTLLDELDDNPDGVDRDRRRAVLLDLRRHGERLSERYGHAPDTRSPT